MTAVNPTSHDALEAILEHAYTAADLNSTLFSESEVLGFMALANIAGGTAYPRMVDIAAAAYLSWPVSQQEDFTAQYTLPSQVRDRVLLGTSSWPEQLSFEEDTLGELTEEQIAQYKRRKSTEIDIFAEEQSLRIMTPGFGKVLTYVWKINEAQKLLAQVANEEEINMAEYPFIAAEVGATAETAPEVATVIMQTAYVWVNCRATMEGAIFAARAALATATVEEVPTIVASAKETILGATEYVISLMNPPEPEPEPEE